MTVNRTGYQVERHINRLILSPCKSIMLPSFDTVFIESMHPFSDVDVAMVDSPYFRKLYIYFTFEQDELDTIS